MNNLKIKTATSKISLTAYRAIKLLEMLMDKPCCAEYIIENFRQDPITESSASKDTLRITLNSLKAVGCRIKRPSIKTNYCYVLEKHPFKFAITKEQLNLLNKIRKNVLNHRDWKTVIKLNSLFDKIADLIEDGELKDYLRYKKPFSKIKPEIIYAIEKGEILKKETIINYASTSKKINKINIYPDKIFCDAGKLYVWAWYFKRNAYSYFNAEKILSIIDIKKTDFEIPFENYNAVYELYGDSIKDFCCESEEKILCKSEDKLVIEYNVVNEFKFFQRLLAFGNDFNLLKPQKAIIKLAEKADAIMERYRDETF